MLGGKGQLPGACVCFVCMCVIVLIVELCFAGLGDVLNLNLNIADDVRGKGELELVRFPRCMCVLCDCELNYVICTLPVWCCHVLSK